MGADFSCCVKEDQPRRAAWVITNDHKGSPPRCLFPQCTAQCVEHVLRHSRASFNWAPLTIAVSVLPNSRALNAESVAAFGVALCSAFEQHNATWRVLDLSQCVLLSWDVLTIAKALPLIINNNSPSLSVGPHDGVRAPRRGWALDTVRLDGQRSLAVSDLKEVVGALGTVRALQSGRDGGGHYYPTVSRDSNTSRRGGSGGPTMGTAPITVSIRNTRLPHAEVNAVAWRACHWLILETDEACRWSAPPPHDDDEGRGARTSWRQSHSPGDADNKTIAGGHSCDGMLVGPPTCNNSRATSHASNAARDDGVANLHSGGNASASPEPRRSASRAFAGHSAAPNAAIIADAVAFSPARSDAKGLYEEVAEDLYRERSVSSGATVLLANAAGGAEVEQGTAYCEEVGNAMPRGLSERDSRSPPHSATTVRSTAPAAPVPESSSSANAVERPTPMTMSSSPPLAVVAGVDYTCLIQSAAARAFGLSELTARRILEWQLVIRGWEVRLEGCRAFAVASLGARNAEMAAELLADAVNPLAERIAAFGKDALGQLCAHAHSWLQVVFSLVEFAERVAFEGDASSSSSPAAGGQGDKPPIAEFMEQLSSVGLSDGEVKPLLEVLSCLPHKSELLRSLSAEARIAELCPLPSSASSSLPQGRPFAPMTPPSIAMGIVYVGRLLASFCSVVAAREYLAPFGEAMAASLGAIVGHVADVAASSTESDDYEDEEDTEAEEQRAHGDESSPIAQQFLEAVPTGPVQHASSHEATAASAAEMASNVCDDGTWREDHSPSPLAESLSKLSPDGSAAANAPASRFPHYMRRLGPIGGGGGGSSALASASPSPPRRGVSAASTRAPTHSRDAEDLRGEGTSDEDACRHAATAAGATRQSRSDVPPAPTSLRALRAASPPIGVQNTDVVSPPAHNVEERRSDDPASATNPVPVVKTPNALADYIPATSVLNRSSAKVPLLRGSASNSSGNAVSVAPQPKRSPAAQAAPPLATTTTKSHAAAAPKPFNVDDDDDAPPPPLRRATSAAIALTPRSQAGPSPSTSQPTSRTASPLLAASSSAIGTPRMTAAVLARVERVKAQREKERRAGEKVENRRFASVTAKVSSRRADSGGKDKRAVTAAAAPYHQPTDARPPAKAHHHADPTAVMTAVNKETLPSGGNGSARTLHPTYRPKEEWEAATMERLREQQTRKSLSPSRRAHSPPSRVSYVYPSGSSSLSSPQLGDAACGVATSTVAMMRDAHARSLKEAAAQREVIGGSYMFTRPRQPSEEGSGVVSMRGVSAQALAADYDRLSAQYAALQHQQGRLTGGLSPLAPPTANRALPPQPMACGAVMQSAKAPKKDPVAVASLLFPTPTSNATMVTGRADHNPVAYFRSARMRDGENVTMVSGAAERPAVVGPPATAVVSDNALRCITNLAVGAGNDRRAAAKVGRPNPAEYFSVRPRALSPPVA